MAAVRGMLKQGGEATALTYSALLGALRRNEVPAAAALEQTCALLRRDGEGGAPASEWERRALVALEELEIAAKAIKAAAAQPGDSSSASGPSYAEIVTVIRGEERSTSAKEQ